MTREEAREIARDAWRNRGHGDFYKTPDAISDALYDALTPPAPVVDDAAVERALDAYCAWTWPYHNKCNEQYLDAHRRGTGREAQGSKGRTQCPALKPRMTLISAV